MTNFEHMKKRVLDAVSALDEEELWQFVTDTCMDERDAEGIFSCGLCEGVFGDCDVIPGRNGCMKKIPEMVRRRVCTRAGRQESYTDETGAPDKGDQGGERCQKPGTERRREQSHNTVRTWQP